MSPVQNTAFVLGAGFSVEQGYPLAYTMRNQVIDFLVSEQHPEYWGFMKPGNGGYSAGQFYEGLQTTDPKEELGFEELLLKLAQLSTEKQGLSTSRTKCSVRA